MRFKDNPRNACLPKDRKKLVAGFEDEKKINNKFKYNGIFAKHKINKQTLDINRLSPEARAIYIQSEEYLKRIGKLK